MKEAELVYLVPAASLNSDWLEIRVMDENSLVITVSRETPESLCYVSGSSQYPAWMSHAANGYATISEALVAMFAITMHEPVVLAGFTSAWCLLCGMREGDAMHMLNSA